MSHATTAQTPGNAERTTARAKVCHCNVDGSADNYRERFFKVLSWPHGGSDKCARVISHIRSVNNMASPGLLKLSFALSAYPKAMNAARTAVVAKIPARTRLHMGSFFGTNDQGSSCNDNSRNQAVTLRTPRFKRNRDVFAKNRQYLV